MKRSYLLSAAILLPVTLLLPFAAPAEDAHKAAPAAAAKAGVKAVAVAEPAHGAAAAEPAHGAAAAEPAHGAAAAAGAAPAAAQGHGNAPHWGYEDPSVWAELSDEFKTCGGQEQSPIDINSAKAIPAAFEPVGIHWLPFKPSFLNNGHTLQANAKGMGGYAELGGDRYELLQFHFHAASEHTIDGKPAPMEVHFVHRNKAGKLLVLGAMIEEGEGNPDITALWSKVPASGEEIQLEGMLDPLNMVPRNHLSYRYAGSLTTPPCSEVVTWNVFAEPVTFSADQIGAFTRQYSANARPVQPVNRRFVLTDRAE